MANLMTIKLNKNAGASWGFRLQGGKDFATPLCIQKVNGGSVAEHAGLQAGDSIVSINGHDALALRHKEAQDTIMKAGNNFDLVIQRGSCIWRPNVTALPEKTTLPDGIPVATKTSLAANQKPVRYVGSNHNCLPRPFPGAFNNDVPSATLKTVSAPTSKVQNGQSHSSPAYDKATVTNGFHSTPEPFSNAGKDGCESKNSSTSFPHFGIDEATSVLTISGTDVSLDKENARNFLMMTLDKENVNTLNLLQNSSKLPQTIPKTNGSSFRSHSIHNLQPTFSGTSRSASSSSVGSTHDLLGRGFRKHSFGSNCSSVSSASSHDGDSESSNHSQKDKLVNVQYNTPLNLYSEDSIAETLSAQAEVLDKGVLGVNFMKNDKSYDGRASDVLRMVQEMDNEPQCETPGTPTNILGTLDRPVVHGYSFKLLQRALDDEVTPPTQGFPSGQIAHGGPGGEHHAGENICSACQRLIVGVFVRIKNKNLHAECFKCSTCGSSLKNVGYYNISDKLYCDIHAKQAARTHPPAPNLEPVTIQPGAAPPPGAISLPQASKMKIPVAFQHDKEHAPAPVLAPDPAPAPVPEPEVPEPVPQEIPEPAPEPVTEPIFVPEPELEVAPQPQVAPLHVDEVVEAPPILPPIEMEGPPQERSPVPAPAPHKPFAPAPAPAPAPVAAAPMKPAPAPAFHSAANPQGFGAPAGDVNVRSHIPRKGTVNAASSQGSETPTCHVCHAEMRGPFVSALGKTWCPDHFVCATSTCKKNLIDMGFVEEQGELYCEHCYESYLAPICGKCDKRVKGDCLNAVGKQFHPECFCCAYCGKVFGSGAFYLEDGLPYCETDWNELFTTKCVGCNFPIEAGDRWVEALNNNYHSQCFKCSKCHKNLEGQSFFAKGGKPFCKIHAQRGF